MKKRGILAAILGLVGVLSFSHAGRAVLDKDKEVRNRDLILRSTSTKKSPGGELVQEVRIHLRSRIGALEKQVKGQLLAIYKVPVQGGVYCYTTKDLGIDFEEKSQWKKTINIPHKHKVNLKFDGEAQASDKEVTFYDYMLIINTTDKEPLLYATKSSWKRLQPKLQELGVEKPFDSSGKPATKLARKLTPAELKAARLRRNGIK